MTTGRIALCASMLLLQSAAAYAISGAQSDTFSSGLENWTQGQTPALTQVTTGGPAGAGDAFLQMVADGGGAQGRLITFNDTQWTGDYTAAGVTSIAVDFQTSTTPLSMRLALKTGSGATPGYLTDAFALPADGLWHHAVFQLDAAHLTPVNSPTDLPTFLTSVGELRILHSTTVSLNGNNITATVGIDNVAVVPAPEPASLCILAIGALALSRRRLLFPCTASKKNLSNPSPFTAHTSSPAFSRQEHGRKAQP